MNPFFSSFAISVAANIVTSLFARNDTEKEIRKAFQEAIEEWCPNEDVRRYQEPFIYNFVNAYIENPTLDAKTLTEDQRTFLKCFEKSIARHPSASLYLSAIKERSYYDMVMASLERVHSKLDAISQKLDEANPKDEDLHFEAVAEINTVLKEVVEDSVNVFLHGITSAFDEEIYVSADPNDDGDIEVVIDKDSRLVEDEDGERYRPKTRDFEYDWNKEHDVDWTELDLDIDLEMMFGYSYMAAFQLMRIDFERGIEKLQDCIDRKSINDQLSTEEKKQLAEIVANMRAVQSVFDEHHDIIAKIDCQMKNLEIKFMEKFDHQGVKLGTFMVCYNDGDYSEPITETIAPLEVKDNLLDVVMINPEYHFKLAGYLGGLVSQVNEWWRLSSLDKPIGEND